MDQTNTEELGTSLLELLEVHSNGLDSPMPARPRGTSMEAHINFSNSLTTEKPNISSSEARRKGANPLVVAKPRGSLPKAFKKGTSALLITEHHRKPASESPCSLYLAEAREGSQD